MNLELLSLGWAAVLGLVHIIVASHVRTKELGVTWNMSPRDNKLPQLSVLAGRLARAQANFFETFPLFAAAILMVVIIQAYSLYSYWGALIYLFARIIYLPLYAFGIPKIRTLVWLISIIGLLMVLLPLLILH
ncbi:MAG TPA: MAPEG family protein [Methylotenera sp.]|nr:MAPEG family protein [Methylotenera sp.]